MQQGRRDGKAHGAQGAQALNLLASPFFNTAIRPTLFAKATAQGTPSISHWAESAAEGGALAYGPSINDIFRQHTVQGVVQRNRLRRQCLNGGQHGRACFRHTRKHLLGRFIAL